MTDAVINPIEAPRKLYFDWIPGVLFTPRQFIPKIATQNRSNWLTPMLVLTLSTLLLIYLSGPARLAASMSSGASLPADFQNMPPEMQAQYQQASQATQGPVFMYLFPALVSLGKVWIGWLLVGGILHLVLTLLGGRGNTGATINLVAWAGLPFFVRDIVRAVAISTTQTLIANPGLSGFVPAGGRLLLFVSKLLGQIDIYVVWHVLLLALGIRAANGLGRGKVWTGVLITILLILVLEALLGFGTSMLGGLNIIRPFMF